MIHVHNIFVCKPGNASKLAKIFKEALSDNEDFVHVMTDLTGQFNRVIMVNKYENLTGFEMSFDKYLSDSEEVKKMKELMKGYTELYVTGSREIYNIV